MMSFHGKLLDSACQRTACLPALKLSDFVGRQGHVMDISNQKVFYSIALGPVSRAGGLYLSCRTRGFFFLLLETWNALNTALCGRCGGVRQPVLEMAWAMSFQDCFSRCPDAQLRL